MKYLGACRIKRPINFRRLHHRLRSLSLDDRLETLRLIYRSGAIDQVRRLKLGIEIQVKQRAHVGRQHERSQKIFAQPFAADYIQIFVAYSHCGHRHQRQRRALLRIELHQERTACRPIFLLRHPLHFVTKPRRPFRGRNDRAVRAHKIEEVQLMRLRHPARVVHVNGNVRVRPAEVYRHSYGRLRVRDSLHAMQNVMPSPLELFLELRHQRVRVLLI